MQKQLRIDLEVLSMNLLNCKVKRARLGTSTVNSRLADLRAACLGCKKKEEMHSDDRISQINVMSQRPREQLAG